NQPSLRTRCKAKTGASTKVLREGGSHARRFQTMHQWRKLAEPGWLSAHESPVQARSRGRLVIISRPGRKRLQLEIACTSRNLARKLIEEFGGRAEKWPR